MKTFFLTAAITMASLAGPVAAKSFNQIFPDHPGYESEELMTLLQQMDYRQGEVNIGGGVAKLQVPDDFYYLGPEDARTVLEDLWGNPPGSETLGMIFATSGTPFDDESWGVDISWEEIGYVSDDDAETIDYDDLLAEIQRDARSSNQWRRENGYEAIEIVGWAAEPYYDATARKLHWAKELHFEGVEQNTLNYSIRALGRRGVMQLNFIAGMGQLDVVEKAVPPMMQMVSFTDGNRYSDFDPSVDTLAAVGIGGLIAGKVLSKAGILAVALIFLKKFWFLVLIPVMALGKLFKRS